MAKTIVVICPFCGESQPAGDSCRSCRGFFDELSRQATHNDMGPWFIRSAQRPYQPGCSYETLIKLIEREIITKFTIIRGPTSKQFWTIAKRLPGIAHLLGYCHSCDERVSTEDHGCPACGVPFGAYLERNHLGLPSIEPMPWEAKLEESAVGIQHQAAHEKESWSSPTDGRGISSFARDSEISNGAGHHEQRSGATLANAAGYTAPLSESESYEVQPAPTATLPPPPPGSARGEYEPSGRDPSHASRALRRELSKQRRLSAILIAMLIIAVVIMLLTNLDRLSTQTDSQDDAKPEGEAAAALDAAPTKPASETASQELDMAAKMSRAEYLLDQAGDDARSFNDRVKDYEEALEILHKLRDTGRASPEIPVLIAQAEAAKEKLEFDELLP